MKANPIVKTVRICMLASLLLTSSTFFSQEGVVFTYKEKIKKENGLLGVKLGDEWKVPAEYTEIKGFDSYLFCKKGEIYDIYRSDYGQQLFIKGVRSEHLNFYKNYLVGIRNNNSYCTPYFENGKWGFTEKGENSGAKFDSLFLLCIQNSTDNFGRRGCGRIMGVYLDGKRGVSDNSGKLVVKPGDYTDIQFYYNDSKKGEFSDRFEIICTHSSGVKVIFIWLKENKFIRTEAANGLKGYVYEGDFVAPAYKEINYSSLPIADYECLLPDGKMEYRKGTELVPETALAEYKALELKKQKAKKLADEARASGLTVEVSTKTHQFFLYPGWSELFQSSDKNSYLLRSDYKKDKKAAEIFNEGPDSWLKYLDYVGTLNFKIEETENYSLAKCKESFVEFAMNRSGLTKDKVKITEEQVTLEDGRKGLILFYVCYDSKGMISGNYFDCEFSFVSEKSPTTIVTYTFFTEGVPNIAPAEIQPWKDYFKKVLMAIQSK